MPRDIATSDCCGGSATHTCFQFQGVRVRGTAKRILYPREVSDTDRLEKGHVAPLGHLCLPRQSQNQQAPRRSVVIRCPLNPKNGFPRPFVAQYP